MVVGMVAGGAVAAGCKRGQGGEAQRPGVQSASSRPFPMALFSVPDPLSAKPGTVPKALDAFDPQDKWVWPGLVPAGGRSALPGWGVSLSTPFVPPATYRPLNAAMRARNFSVGSLAAGALAAFATPAGQYGLPVACLPTGLMYDVQAFADAGLTVPAGDWSIDVFEGACAALHGAIRAGRLTRFYGVLPTMIGHSQWTDKSGNAHYVINWTGQLTDPNIWGAFVLGYGGWMVRNGRFDLTNRGAVRGLDRLVQIVRQYGSNEKYIPRSQGDVHRLWSGAVMRFVSYRGAPAPTGFRYARFPGLPVRPVVPAQLQGVEPAKMGPGGRGWFPAYVPKDIPFRALEATVAYAQWVYRVVRTSPQLPGNVPPVLADGRVQQAYFGAAQRLRDGSHSIGGWRDYVYVQEGWPLVRQRSRVDPLVGETEWLVYTALTNVVQNASPLAGALAKVTKDLNALVAG